MSLNAMFSRKSPGSFSWSRVSTIASNPTMTRTAPATYDACRPRRSSSSRPSSSPVVVIASVRNANSAAVSAHRSRLRPLIPSDSPPAKTSIPRVIATRIVPNVTIDSIQRHEYRHYTANLPRSTNRQKVFHQLPAGSMAAGSFRPTAVPTARHSSANARAVFVSTPDSIIHPEWSDIESGLATTGRPIRCDGPPTTSRRRLWHSLSDRTRSGWRREWWPRC